MSQRVGGPAARAINHIAISCVDIDALVAWWIRLFKFEVMSPIQHYTRTDHPDAFKYIFVAYPETLQALKFAILTSGNGVAIEVFQFIGPAARRRDTDEAFEYTRAGFFHICVTGPDPEALVQRIVAAGGKQVGDYMDYGRYGHKGHKGIYMQDPWGNVVECMSLSLERVCSAGYALGWYLAKQKQQQHEQEEAELKRRQKDEAPAPGPRPSL